MMFNIFRYIILSIQWIINNLGILDIIEYFFLKKQKQQQGSAVFFIIGAPRTGSTLLYQLMLKKYKFAYITNLASLFYKASSFFSFISQKVWGYYKGDKLESKYGYISGINSPSEAGKLIDYWLKKASKKKVLKTVATLNNIYNSPLLIKNLKTSYHIDKIIDLFPNVKFIHIRRNEKDTISSIKKAQENLSSDSMQWFRVSENKPHKSHEDIIKNNLTNLLEYINTNLAKKYPEKYIEIWYEDIINNEIKNEKLNLYFQKPPFRNS